MIIYSMYGFQEVEKLNRAYNSMSFSLKREAGIKVEVEFSKRIFIDLYGNESHSCDRINLFSVFPQNQGHCLFLKIPHALWQGIY